MFVKTFRIASLMTGRVVVRDDDLKAFGEDFLDLSSSFLISASGRRYCCWD
jgi:hypothetical protein